MGGVKQYYVKKIKSVYIPTIAYIFAVVVLNNPSQIGIYFKAFYKKMLTCTYYGSPGFNDMGATWYVFTLMWLYLLSPVFYRILKYMEEKFNVKGIVIMMVTLMVLSFFYRHYAYINGLNWVTRVYTPFFANIDFYVSGMACALIKKSMNLRLGMGYLCYLFPFLFLATVFVTAYIWGKKPTLMYINMYYMQSMYCLLAVLFIFLYTGKTYKEAKNGIEKVFFLFINKFSEISFEFYLIHSMVLDRLAKFIGGSSSLTQSLKIICVVFFVTVILSCGYHRIFMYSRKRNTIVGV